MKHTTMHPAKTTKNPSIAPAVPTIHVIRMNKITPNMF